MPEDHAHRTRLLAVLALILVALGWRGSAPRRPRAPRREWSPAPRTSPRSARRPRSGGRARAGRSRPPRRGGRHPGRSGPAGGDDPAEVARLSVPREAPRERRALHADGEPGGLLHLPHRDRADGVVGGGAAESRFASRTSSKPGALTRRAWCSRTASRSPRGLAKVQLLDRAGGVGDVGAGLPGLADRRRQREDRGAATLDLGEPGRSPRSSRGGAGVDQLEQGAASRLALGGRLAGGPFPEDEVAGLPPGLEPRRGDAVELGAGGQHPVKSSETAVVRVVCDAPGRDVVPVELGVDRGRPVEVEVSSVS